MTALCPVLSGMTALYSVLVRNVRFVSGLLFISRRLYAVRASHGAKGVNQGSPLVEIPPPFLCAEAAYG